MNCYSIYFQFNPMAHATQRDPGFVLNATFQDKIHCVAFVVDASSIDVLQANVSQKLLHFRSLIVERGTIHNISALTQVKKHPFYYTRNVRLLCFNFIFNNCNIQCIALFCNFLVYNAQMERKETMRGLITKHVFSVTRSFAMYCN